jgi:hypothetical protein
VTFAEVIPAPKKEGHTFAELVQDREVDFPTLARAARNTRRAISVRVEWMADSDDGPTVWTNFTQIVRHPYRATHGEPSNAIHNAALVGFLAAIERILVDGVPAREEVGMAPISWCGGYRHYLGRELADDDLLVLKVLREPFRWTHDWKHRDGEWMALDTPEYEWLAEFTLEVTPGRSA